MKIVENKKYEVSHEVICEYDKLSNLTDVSHFDNGDDLYLIKITDKESKIGDVSDSQTHTKEAIVTSKDLEDITQNISKFANDQSIGGYALPNVSKRDNGIGAISLVDRGFLEHYKKYGIDGYDRNCKRGEEKTSRHYVVESIWDTLKENKTTGDKIFVQLKESPMKFDYIETSEGEKVLPSFYLSYIEGQLDNREYKLEDLAEHLLKNFDVDFYKESRNHTSINSKNIQNEKDLSGIIKSIPHYNQDDGRTECLEIRYYPTKEESEKIIKSNVHLTNDMWDKNQFIVREILGGRSFSVEPVKNDNFTRKNKFR